MDQNAAEAVRYVTTAITIVGVTGKIGYYITINSAEKREAKAALVPDGTKAVADYLKSPEWLKVIEARERVGKEIAIKLVEVGKEPYHIANNIGDIVDGIIGKPVEDLSLSRDIS